MKPTPDAIEDDGFHEIHLSGKQLVFLCMATTVVSVVIFLCGVLVGRGVRAQQGDGTIVASAATLPGTAGAPEPARDDAVPPGDEYSYHKRLEGEEAPKESLVGGADSAPPPVDERPPSPPPADAGPTPTSHAAPPDSTPEASSAPAPESAAGSTPVPASGASRSGYAVQVAATRVRSEADQILKRLLAKGYPGYVIDPPAGAPNAVFRVRVGGYSDRKQAQEISRRLEQDEHFKSPWITR
jgi:cell division septation protein DedD